MENDLTPAPTEEETVEEVSQEQTEATEEAPEGETVEEEKTEEPETVQEPTQADITAKQLLKGYTQTRQDIGEIRTILNDLKGKKDEFVDEDKPLTKKELMEWEEAKERSKRESEQKVNQQIQDQLDDLRVRGVIKSKADEEAIFEYAISERKQGKNKDLITAGLDWQALQEAKREGGKVVAKAKTQVKQEAGSKVGTSQKTASTEQGFDYKEIHSKGFDEFTE